MDNPINNKKPPAGQKEFYKLPSIPDFSSVDSSLYRIPSSLTKSSNSDFDDLIHSPFSSKEKFFEFININIIGSNKVFRGAFGDRRVLYCDYIASGRALTFLEDFIYNEVLPDYGNTHTTTSVTSLQTTMYRHEAKDIVRNAVRASDYDAVFFVGSGCTGAVHKLIHNLHLENPPIVIVGPFEHHSNMLPWRHLAAKVIRLKIDSSGNVSYDHLKECLKIESKEAKVNHCPLIVCLAAASNVTGILLDVNHFSAIVHKYGGFVFWDYATAAPYVKIDMNPVVPGPDCDLIYKDAVYFSMHKFVGGVQTPGVLIAKRVLFKAGETHPDGCGGGSVCFVRREGQIYLQDVEEREEGGTPAIVESIRAGLVMQLKEAITSEAIHAREDVLVQKAWDRLKGCENLLVLGGDKARRLPVFSVVIRHTFPIVDPAEQRSSMPVNSKPISNAVSKGPGSRPESPQPSKQCMFIHHVFVATLLNDLFGVQSRAGCACAGPYAMDLLGIDEALAILYESALVKSGIGSCRISRFFDSAAREVLRPGFTRFSLPYFMSDEEADFVLDSVRFVAMYGWAFLPLYVYNATSGEWRHRRHNIGEDRQWLGHIQYTEDGMIWRRGKPRPRGALPRDCKATLLVAKLELKKAVDFVKNCPISPVPDDTASFDEEMQKLRWFLLPCEAAAQLRGEVDQLAIPTGPCSPWTPGVMDSMEDYTQLENISERVITGREELATIVPRNLVQETLIPNVRQGGGKSDGSAHIPHEPQRRGVGSQGLVTQVLRLESENSIQTRNITSLSTSNERTSEFMKNKQRHNSNIAADDEMTSEPTSEMLIRPISPILKETMDFVSNNKEKAGEREVAFSNINDEELEEFIWTLNDVYRPANSEADIITVNVGLKKCKKIGKSIWKKPIKQLYKPFTKAVKKFNMIKTGDKVLVCLSGGKDSLSLLHCLHQYQESCNRMSNYPCFEFGAATVGRMSTAFDHSPLIPYLAELGVPYLYEKQDTINRVSELTGKCDSISSFYSGVKFDQIYSSALQNGYNVIALGQNLDDMAESFVMSYFHSRAMDTLQAHYIDSKYNLRVIRPLAFVREKVTHMFAELTSLPVIMGNFPTCCFPSKERMRVKRVLEEYESTFPNLYSSLRSAMLPLILKSDALSLSGREDAKRALDIIRQRLVDDEVNEGDNGGLNAS